MRKMNLWMLAAILTFSGAMMTGLSSCTSEVDNPATPQPSQLAKAIVGEWIIEQTVDASSLDGLDASTEPSDGDYVSAVIYHFNEDGSCWKEVNLMQDNMLVNQDVARYGTEESTYTIDATGKVVVKLKDIDNGTETTETLTFDGTKLIPEGADMAHALSRASEVQVVLYQEASDAWHGGSADESPLNTVTQADLGKIIASNGKIYDRYVNALVAHVMPLAMIAYVGSDTDHPTCHNGLAIAVSEEGLLYWSGANRYCNAKTRAPAGAKWVLPSKKQWTNMLLAGGGSIMNDGNYLKDCGWLNKTLSDKHHRDPLYKIYNYDDDEYEYNDNCAYYWTSDVIKATDSDMSNDSGFLLYIYDDHAEFTVSDLDTPAAVCPCLVF